MTRQSDAFATQAEALVGIPFRLGGRDPQFGVDCLGLVKYALTQSGFIAPEIPRYRLRNPDYSFIASLRDNAGFASTSKTTCRGDIVLVKPGPAQRHLLIALEDNRYVHAHAGLGRVVEFHGSIPWAVLDKFRLIEGN